MSYLGDNAFQGTRHVVILPEHIMKGAITIPGCTSLASVTLPTSVTYIGNGTFEGTLLKLILELLIARICIFV